MLAGVDPYFFNKDLTQFLNSYGYTLNALESTLFLRYATSKSKYWTSLALVYLSRKSKYKSSHLNSYM